MGILRLYILLILLPAIGHGRSIDPFHVLKDKKLLKTLVGLPLHQPKAVEKFFKDDNDWDTARTDLGFGWKLRKTGRAGWDVAISAHLYYYQDSLVSYSLNLHFSGSSKRQQRYYKWCQSVFPNRQENDLQFWFNATALETPLPTYKGLLTKVPLSVSRYMSPAAGIEYSYTDSSSRRTFQQLVDSLTNEEILYMLYAVNPVTRFTAVGHYWKYKERFGERPDIDAWIEQLFAASPTVTMKLGCTSYETSSYYWVQMKAAQMNALR